MSTATIRERLYDYIRVADDKKVRAIYAMLEDTIVEDLEWWNNQAVVEELQKRYEAWDSGKEKGYSMSDIDRDIEKLKKKRASN
ncbi:hypothetical protein [Niabella aquatica]